MDITTEKYFQTLGNKALTIAYEFQDGLANSDCVESWADDEHNARFFKFWPYNVDRPIILWITNDDQHIKVNDLEDEQALKWLEELRDKTILIDKPEHRFELPIAYVNLIDAALKYAEQNGLYKNAPDAGFIKGCLEDIRESLIEPLQKIDKDGIIIINQE